MTVTQKNVGSTDGLAVPRVEYMRRGEVRFYLHSLRPHCAAQSGLSGL